MICEPWATPAELDTCCETTASTQQKTDALLSASEILYALSGRQYGGFCQETIRPCAGGAALPGFAWSRWSYPWIPAKFGATWLNIGPACGCHIAWDCGCSGIPQVNLGRSDVQQILRVNIDGTDLSASAYRLDEGRFLVRTDGDYWPCCQDLSKDLGEIGAWYIELEYGRQVPQMGAEAAKKLACELVKACVGEDCALPSRVTSVARQGVSFAILDPQDFLSDGRTGLYEVDLFLKAVNPNGLARRATAWGPGLTGRARRVGVLGS